MNVETIKAVVSMLIVVMVSSFGALGIDVDATALENVIYAILFLGATVFGCYKNHNFTKAAQRGQELINEIKAGK